MTLQKFTTLAARVSDALLRPAIVAALTKGAPRTAREFLCFHEDVIDELRGAAHRVDPTATAVEPARVDPDIEIGGDIAMTHYGGKELARSFRQVRGNTIQTAEDIPGDKYGFQASPDTRSIGASLVHIAVSTGFQDYIQRNKVTDLKDVNFMELVQKFSAEEAKPRTKAETIAYLKSQGEAFASFLEGLSDEFLAEPVAMPPGAEPATKTRFEMLLSPKEHEMHHRGQLMLLQRMIGLVPHLTRQMQERMAQHAPAAKTTS